MGGELGLDQSDRSRGVAVFRPDPGHMFQLARVGDVVAGFVLGQNLHEWAELQPPLLLWDPVAGRVKLEDEVKPFPDLRPT